MARIAKIDLTTTPPTIVAQLEAVPEIFAGIPPDELLDAAWAGMNGMGYWPEEKVLLPIGPNEVNTEEVVGPPVLVPHKGYAIVTYGKRALTEEEITTRNEELKQKVMVLRDETIDAGVVFNGVMYQSRPNDRENIAGAAQLAFMALVGGVQPGDLRWADPDQDFGWIAMDNSIVLMDAPTVIAFARRAAGFKSACTFYARWLKDQIDAAEDPSTIDITVGWPT